MSQPSPHEKRPEGKGQQGPRWAVLRFDLNRPGDVRALKIVRAYLETKSLRDTARALEITHLTVVTRALNRCKARLDTIIAEAERTPEKP